MSDDNNNTVPESEDVQYYTKKHCREYSLTVIVQGSEPEDARKALEFISYLEKIVDMAGFESVVIDDAPVISPATFNYVFPVTISD